MSIDDSSVRVMFEIAWATYIEQIDGYVTYFLNPITFIKRFFSIVIIVCLCQKGLTNFYMYFL